MFRQVFERVVEACIAAGLVSGEGFAVWRRKRDSGEMIGEQNKDI